MDTISLRQTINNVHRYVRQKDPRAAKELIEFYKSGLESPSIATLLLRDEFNKESERQTEEIIEDFYANKISQNEMVEKLKPLTIIDILLNQIDCSDEVKPFVKTFAEKYKQLYPKTSELRQKLIVRDRVAFDYVTPKATWLQKLKLAKYLKK